MPDYPRSLVDFQRRFPDDAACAHYLAALRWPDGFSCPSCGHAQAWALRTKPWTYECRGCRCQTSVKAGTILHGSKLALTTWFWAAYLMATHSNGISALQLQRLLGLGSYKSAWLLCAKLRRAMVAPERTPLAGLVEIDESAIRHRTAQDPPAGGQGRSHDGKLLIAGAVEILGAGALAVPGAHPAGRHRRLLRRQPASLHGRQHGTRQHRKDRRLASLSRRTRGQPPAPRDRRHGRPSRPALDPPRLLKPQNLGARRLPRPAGQATSRPISTSSSSASIGAGPDTPPSDPCSSSPQQPSPSHTKC